MSSSFQKTAFASPNVAIIVDNGLTTITTDSHKPSSADFGDLSVGLASHDIGGPTSVPVVSAKESASTSGEGSYHNNSPQGESSDASLEHCTLLNNGTSYSRPSHIAGGTDCFAADVSVINAVDSPEAHPSSQNSSIGSANEDPAMAVVSVLISTAATGATAPNNISASENVSSSPETNTYNNHAASSSFEEDHLLIGGGATSCPTSNVSATRENDGVVDTNDPVLPQQYSPTASPSAGTMPPTPLLTPIATGTSQTHSATSTRITTGLRNATTKSEESMFGDCGIELEIDESGYADEDDEKGKAGGSSDDEPVSPKLSTSTALPSPSAGYNSEVQYQHTKNGNTTNTYTDVHGFSQSQNVKQHLGCTNVPYSSHRSFRVQQQPSFMTSTLSAPHVHSPMGDVCGNSIHHNNIILSHNSKTSTTINTKNELARSEKGSEEDLSGTSDGDEDLFFSRQRSDVWNDEDDEHANDFQLDDKDNHCQYTSYSLSQYCSVGGGKSNPANHAEDADDDGGHTQQQQQQQQAMAYDAAAFHAENGYSKDSRWNNNHHHAHSSTTHLGAVGTRHRNPSHTAIAHHLHFSSHFADTNSSTNGHAHTNNSSTTSSSNNKKKSSKGGKRNRNFALIADVDDLLNEGECDSQSLEDEDDDEELVAGNVEDVDLSLEEEKYLAEIDAEDIFEDELGNEEDNEEGAFESDDLDLNADSNATEQNYTTNFNRADVSHLNLDEQRSIIAFAKRQRASEYNEMMTSQQHLRLDQQTVSIKILLNEAHRHQITQLRRAAASPSRISEAHGSWREVGFNAEDDFEEPQFLQRRLSCMCMFTPTLANRSYQDNDGERGARIRRQHDLLMRLKVQEQNGGNPYFFEGPDIQGQHVVQLTSEFEKQCEEDDDDDDGFAAEDKKSEADEEAPSSSQAQYIPRRSENMTVHITSPNPSTPEEGDEDESKTCVESNENEYDWINHDPTARDSCNAGRGSSRFDNFLFDEDNNGEGTLAAQSFSAVQHAPFDDELDESDALLLSVL